MSGVGSSAVKYGVFVYDVTLPELIAIGQLAEQLGFEGIWLGEHLVWPVGYGGHHPTQDAATENVKPIIAADTNLFDLAVGLGALAATTHELMLGTSMYLLTARHPLATARTVASVVEASHDRFRFGIGLGWMREEYEALGVAFDGRGAQFDETVEIMRAAWTGQPFEHTGANWDIPLVQVTPQPVTVPLILGGNGDKALRRAARIGDGWINSGYATVDAASRCRDAIDAERQRIGRTSPFGYWVRPTDWTLAESEAFVAEGFLDQVIQLDAMWVRGNRVDIEEKLATMRAWADQFGLTPRSPAAGRQS